MVLLLIKDYLTASMDACLSIKQAKLHSTFSSFLTFRVLLKEGILIIDVQKVTLRQLGEYLISSTKKHRQEPMGF